VDAKVEATATVVSEVYVFFRPDCFLVWFDSLFWRFLGTDDCLVVVDWPVVSAGKVSSMLTCDDAEVEG